MPTLASAARLIAKCSTAEGTAPLLAELGFPSNPVPVTADAAEALALPPQCLDVRVASGPGNLRALVISVDGSTDLRVFLTHTARTLLMRAPQLLFLVVVINQKKRLVALAAFDAVSGRPHVATLIVDLDRIVDSDAETVCSLAGAVASSALLTHCRWVEILGRESVGRRFFRDLERLVENLARSLPGVRSDDSRHLALLCVSRLLFLSFLETKGWLDRDHGFLANRFADCMVSGGSYHRRVLTPLFFGTLNTPPDNRAQRAREFGRVPFLNGGLFARSPIEARTSKSFFSDEALGDLFGDLLSRYRFTAREASLVTEAAIDPEMLGKAFECLMSAADRKGSGAFYTPHSLVREVCASALGNALSSASVTEEIVAAALRGTIPDASARAELLRSACGLRVLDPACGSGAFLVEMLEALSTLRLRLGDLRAPHSIRRDVLTRAIFGVDINPLAAWLCELRLWLAMAIEDPEVDPLRVKPLPNLDRNIRVGDSLAGSALSEQFSVRGAGRLAVLRGRYSRATGRKKRLLSKTLDSLERDYAVAAIESRINSFRSQRRELLIGLRAPDLFGKRNTPSIDARARLATLRREVKAGRDQVRRLRDGAALPFSFAASFADAAAAGGFDIVIGNPPWIRTHNLALHDRARLRETFFVYRNAAWAEGAQSVAAGKGFSSQIDAAALFTERSVNVVKPGGTLSIILPIKLWRSLAGGGVRQFVQKNLRVREIHDLSSGPQLFDAAVYPSVIVGTRYDSPVKSPHQLTIVARRKYETTQWEIEDRGLSFDDSPGSPWIIAPPLVRSAFDLLTRSGKRMSETHLGRPMLGVKTGCNDAFIVDCDDAIEPWMLRTVVRGDQIRKWAVHGSHERIIWTHDDNGPLRAIPPRAAMHLSSWRRQLELRADARGARWWTLFRTEAASGADYRVVWSDIGKSLRAAVIPRGCNSVPLNTCYVVRCRKERDAYTIAAILNNSIASAWLSLLAEPARGGYFRYLGWTMSLLPLPSDWNHAAAILAPLGRSACEGYTDDDELLAAVAEAYRVRLSALQPLLEWNQ